MFALLGPNSAGKTTTVEILEGHRQRTSGKLRSLVSILPGGRDFVSASGSCSSHRASIANLRYVSRCASMADVSRTPADR